MSILIKGMEMPKNCAVCRLEKDLFGRAVCFGYEDGRALYKDDLPPVGSEERRPSWCPLVPVPEHGRLIDGDALRQAMYHEAFETDSPMQKWDSGCWIRYKMFERMEEAALTIIPADKESE